MHLEPLVAWGLEGGDAGQRGANSRSGWLKRYGLVADCAVFFPSGVRIDQGFRQDILEVFLAVTFVRSDDALAEFTPLRVVGFTGQLRSGFN